MNSYTEENYLKAIFKLSELAEGEVSTNAIAEKINTKAASVTDMLKKLSEKKLINYQRYQGVTLTEKGKKVALYIIRKHRLWEHFLVEKLHFRWDEVHEMAEQLEHVVSTDLIDRLDKFLGFPKFDPHGDPIPDGNGKFQQRQSEILAEMKENEKGTMTGVVDHSPTFLQYLDKLELTLGSTIKIKEVNEYDHSLLILLNNKKELFISHEVAKNLLITT